MKSPVRIVFPPDGRLGHGTRVFTEDGSEIENITGITIRIEPSSLIMAEIEMHVKIDDIVAHPFLTLDLLRTSAEAHGFDLVKRKEPNQ